jgi:beta-glucanase (GH16 family)
MMISLSAASFALALSCLAKSANSFALAPAGYAAFVRNERINNKNCRTIRPMAFADTNWDDQKSQYEDIFRDDFDGNSIDTTMWNHEIGPGPGNGEVQYYTDSKENAYVEDSVLHIKALRDREYDGKTYEWTSARLNTQGNFNFTFGRMSARIRCEPVAGPFSAGKYGLLMCI